MTKDESELYKTYFMQNPVRVSIPKGEINARHLENRLFINKKKKVVAVITWQGIKRVVKCDKDDKFDWRIGLALAIERSSNKNGKIKYKKMRELFTNKKGNLDYKKYAKWVLFDFFGYYFNEEDFYNNKMITWKVKVYE